MSKTRKHTHKTRGKIPSSSDNPPAPAPAKAGMPFAINASDVGVVRTDVAAK